VAVEVVTGDRLAVAAREVGQTDLLAAHRHLDLLILVVVVVVAVTRHLRVALAVQGS